MTAALYRQPTRQEECQQACSQIAAESLCLGAQPIQAGNLQCWCLQWTDTYGGTEGVISQGVMEKLASNTTVETRTLRLFRANLQT
jgi:hypothetical protein